MTGYKFKNDTYENLCEHNAKLALNSNKPSVSNILIIISLQK